MQFWNHGMWESMNCMSKFVPKIQYAHNQKYTEIYFFKVSVFGHQVSENGHFLNEKRNVLGAVQFKLWREFR